jgi:hypothetical protein
MKSTRNDLARLSDLQDHARRLPGSYDFDATDNPIHLKFLRGVEADLRGLDPTSWGLLKAEVAPLVAQKDLKRGWQPLWDKLNEAKGYNHLAGMGCSEVRLIPRASAKHRRTPDVEGILGETKVLCEVKTINPSEGELSHRSDFSVRTIAIRLPVEFFNKLKKTLETARDQMTGYCSAVGTRKIALVVINYDDMLHEYVGNYSTQIEAFIATKPVPDLEIVFDSKPAFYFATV